MILVILYILALSLDNDVIASFRIDDVIVRFIVNATPALFPPSRISLQLCINYGTIFIILSSNYLIHNIHNSYEELNPKIYNNLEHQNLYMLNLCCDYAIDAHSKRMFVAPTKWLLFQDRRAMIDNDNNVNLTFKYDDSVLEIFKDMAIYPDSDVILAQRFDGDFFKLLSIYRPSSQRGVIWENRGNWTIKNGLKMSTFDVASARRKNLQQTALKSCLVMTDPNTINHLTDFKDKSVDPVTKANYPWILHLVNRMNATISFEVTNSWGYRTENGSWSGMIGMLERHEIDIGGTATFLVPERIGVVQYVQLYTHTRSRFIFRRPLLSTVRNIFTLPFQRNVWIAIAVFLVLVFCLLYLSIKWEYNRDRISKSAAYWNQLNPSKPTISDNLLILLGAFSQQGYSFEPYRVSSRIVTLMLLLASLSLYAAYTANIVSLLQSTTDSIKTLRDLLNSPLKLGVQDVVYNRHYFKSFQDSVRKTILKQRIEPKGSKSNWMSVEEGVRRVRNKLFAFHGEIGTVYQLMQDTYLEEQKCGLTEIDFLNVLYPLLVIQEQSPYSEIIKNGALKLREYGLKYREEYRLYTRKPVCASQTSFITIGFTECYFALVIMGYGILLCVIVFAFELLWHKSEDKCDQDDPHYPVHPRVITRECRNSSFRIDDVIVRFIVNATPALFPPSRISLQLIISFRADDTIELSRILSSNYLMHNIHNFYEELNPKIYNNLEHQNLYMLNLDCDYAIDILRQAHSKRLFVAPTKWLLFQDRRAMIDNDNNVNLTFTYNDSVLEIFEDLAIYPDSDVILARRFDGDFLELLSIYRPSSQKDVIWENRGNWTIENGLQMSTFDVASARRRNLQQTALKSCIVVTDPNTINHLTDFKDKFIDAPTKTNYPWILHLANRMNATISFEITNNWGYRTENGSWSGMTGMLERREIDISGTPSFLIPERIDVIQYIQLYTHTCFRFVFRRPLLSTISNIFTLPFQRNVWIAIAVFLVLVFCLLYLSIKWEYDRGRMTESAAYWNQLNPSKPTISDNLLILLGAFSQQGYWYEPYRVSSRIVTLMLLLVSMSLYAAYTANIVGLLQSTADSIKTLPDLLNSPLNLGVHDVPYNRHYFKSVQDPIRKTIVEQRIEPKGSKSNWMSIEEGVRRVRNELFAFHGEIGSIYQLTQDTYLEEEKCGLTEIDFLNVIYPLIMIQKQSPYLEIIKNGALKLREYGLKYHEEYHLYTRKPVCSSQTSFISIGFTECYFALVIMGYGILFSVIVFAFELLWHKR
ncbi:GLRK protein, partial [Acromyrmex charruanus]